MHTLSPFWLPTGTVFGALGAHFVTDRFGRRRTFIMAAVGFIIGVLIESFGNSYSLLLFGRFFVGLGVGIGLAIDPLYIAEVTPAKHRGELVTWSEIALNIGLVFGFSTGLTLAGIPADRRWRYMFFLGIFLPILMIILVLCVLPESPRWLVAKQREEEARAVLEKVYPEGYNVDAVIDDIKEAIQRETAAENGVGWGVIFRPTPAFRRMLLVGVGMAIAQQSVGIDAIQYYLLDILAEGGVENKKANGILMLLGVVKLVFIFVGGKLFDRRGRRPLLFVSLLGMAVSLLVVGIAFAANEGLSTAFIVTGLAFYLAFFSTALGPAGWLIPSEVFAICIRAKAMSVATFGNRVTATLMSSTFLSTANGMGWAGFFIFFAAICIVVLAFVYFFVPETRGRSLEDMSLYFAEITHDNSVLEAEARIRGENKSVEMPFYADPSGPERRYEGGGEVI